MVDVGLWDWFWVHCLFVPLFCFFSEEVDAGDKNIRQPKRRRPPCQAAAASLQQRFWLPDIFITSANLVPSSGVGYFRQPIVIS